MKKLHNIKVWLPDLTVFMRESIKLCQKGSDFDKVFLVDEGREDPSTTISGPLTTRQRNVIKCRFAGVPIMAHIECWHGSCDFQGIRTCIARKPLIIVIFHGGGGGGGPDSLLPPPPWIRKWSSCSHVYDFARLCSNVSSFRCQ